MSNLYCIYINLLGGDDGEGRGRDCLFIKVVYYCYYFPTFYVSN